MSATKTAMKDEVFRALADPTRRAIFERLTRGESTVAGLKQHFDVSQPAISQHLAHLLRAGLVANRPAGRQVYYRVAAGGLKPVVDWLEQYRSFWHERIQRMKDVLEEMDE
jgi:DNA-binding transcriptional ArsR family regulator